MVVRSNSTPSDVARKARMEFPDLELHLLADWLESPEFPRGLHTFSTP